MTKKKRSLTNVKLRVNRASETKEQRKERLGSSLGTTLRNATQAKHASQGFIGKAERTRGTK